MNQTAAAMNTRTKELAALDHAHVWHPFTPMRQWRQQQPSIIERAEGFTLIDTEGQRFVDGVSSLWCNVHGHRVPEIDQAIRDQLDKVAHTTLLGLASPPSIELAAQLVQRAPSGLRKVFYSDSGATALEVAFKIAVGYFFHQGQAEKTRFIGLAGAYHGDTTAAMAVGRSELFHRPFFSMLFETDWFPAIDACRAPAELLQRHPHPRDEWPSENRALNQALAELSLSHLRSQLERDGHRTAAIVVEPIMQGAAGMIAQPHGFLREVEKLAREHNVLLIADEVAVGFGRTGTLFACEQDGVQPDILCVAKGLTGGYLPLAATLTTDALEDAFTGELSERRTLYHGHTYTGNPLACAAALASLKLFDDRDVLAHAIRSAELIREQLAPLRACKNVLDVRQRGVMVGIELCADRNSQAAFDFAARTGAELCRRIREKGVIVRPLGDVIVLMPAPAMDHDTLTTLLSTTVQTILEWSATL